MDPAEVEQPEGKLFEQILSGHLKNTTLGKTSGPGSRDKGHESFLQEPSLGDKTGRGLQQAAWCWGPALGALQSGRTSQGEAQWGPLQAQDSGGLQSEWWLSWVWWGA